MTQTREIADGIARKHEPVVSFRDVLAADIDAALIAYGNARIEDAAKVAEARETIFSDRDGTPIGDCPTWESGEEIASAIRSLATKEGS